MHEYRKTIKLRRLRRETERAAAAKLALLCNGMNGFKTSEPLRRAWEAAAISLESEDAAVSQ